jgi:hypothetical protein
VCKEFLNKHKGTGTLFWINSTSAKFITQYSQFSAERESILLPGSKFKIVNKTIDPHNKNLIIAEMEEVISDPKGNYITLEKML